MSGLEEKDMKLDRLLGITMELLRQKKVTAPELAEKFEVSVRTIYRDMDTIGLAGIPIMATSGSTGGFELMPGYFLTKQHFSVEELSMIYHFFKGLEDSSSPEAAGSITQKLATLRPDMAQNTTILFDLQASPEETKYLTVIHQAIAESQTLLLTYSDSQGQKTQREIIPYHLLWERGVWYIESFCLLRQAKRHFRVSRIETLSISGKWDAPKPELTDDVYDESSGILTTLEFSFSVISRVKAQFPSEWEETKQGIRVNTTFYDEDYALSVLLSYGQHVKVLSPDYLKNNLLCTIRKIQALYKEENV